MVGANGAGKTTIMKSILSLIKSEGQIKINGTASDFEHHQALKSAGALIEYPGIYPFLSGRDHLELFIRPGDDKSAQIQTIVTELHMAKYIDQRAKSYSLGMKQKLGIAMALLNSPNLVILDEPMNGLDPQATRDLRNLILKKSAQGVTFLISSHILGELQKLVEDLVIIDHGKVIKLTTMNQLLASSNHYLIVKTNDDRQSLKLLKRSGYDVIAEKPLKIQLTEDIFVEDILELLVKSGFSVTDIKHEDSDLEDSVLKLMTE